MKRRLYLLARQAARRGWPNLPVHLSAITVAVAGAGVTVSAVVEAIDGGDEVWTLGLCGICLMVVGVVGWILTTVPSRVHLLDVFATVSGSWLAIAVAGALPYVVTGTITAFDDALFEAISGFTTTGATVLRPIEGTAKGLLFWRSITQWLGGMGVIVLVVAVLPTVGSGGFDLLEAEAPGPAGERLTPRVRHTAVRLYVVYAGFTVVLCALYLLGGMSIYDAVSHSFTTVSTGGFSPYNASLGHFDSAYIEWVAIGAMFAAGTSFTLIYRVLRGRPGSLIASVEFRLYCSIVVIATAMVWLLGDVGSGHEAIRDSAFAVTAVTSTTGFATADFGSWSEIAQMLLLLAMPLGAMAGSTAGGVKLIRVLSVASFAHRATLRQLHPTLVRPIRVGNDVIDEAVSNKVLGYLVLALASFGGGAFLMALFGADLVTALSGAATMFGNVGPGLAEVGPSSDFLNLPRAGRWVGMGLMLLGRLEIYPILLALAIIPQPWRRWFRSFRNRRRTAVPRR